MKNLITWNGKECVVHAVYETYALCSFVGQQSKFSVPVADIDLEKIKVPPVKVGYMRTPNEPLKPIKYRPSKTEGK